MKITDIDKIRNIIKDYLKYYDYYTPESTSRAKATRGTTQSINSDTWTKIQYNTEVFDELGEYDNTANYRFTAQKAGYYQVNAGVISAAASWGPRCFWRIYLWKNGSTHESGTRNESQTTHTAQMHSTYSNIIYLNTSDYIEGYIYHTQGGAVNIDALDDYNYFSVHRLS